MFGILETFIGFVIGIIELFLGFRFIFRLLGANPSAPFVSWLYDTTDPLINPFRGIFPTPRIEGMFAVEFTTLLALLVYMIAGYVLLEIISAIRGISTRRVL